MASAGRVLSRNAGVPNFVSAIGQLLLDTANNDFYGNTDGSASGWKKLNDGALTASAFTFTHTSGGASTGALGFTPVAAIYFGVIEEAGKFTQAVGFATGTGTSAKSTSQEDNGKVSSDADAIGGTSGGVSGDTSFPKDLDVTAFASGGITLTFSAAVTSHVGFLLVLG